MVASTCLAKDANEKNKDYREQFISIRFSADYTGRMFSKRREGIEEDDEGWWVEEEK